MKILASEPPERVNGRVTQGGPRGFFVRSSRTPVDPVTSIQSQVRAIFITMAKVWRFSTSWEKIGWKQFYPGYPNGPATVVAAYLSAVLYGEEFLAYPDRGLSAEDPVYVEVTITPTVFDVLMARPDQDYYIIAVRASNPLATDTEPPSSFTPWFLAWYRDDRMRNLAAFYSETFPTRSAGQWIYLESVGVSGDDLSAVNSGYVEIDPD